MASIDRECHISHDNLKCYLITISFLSLYSYVYLNTSNSKRYAGISSDAKKRIIGDLLGCEQVFQGFEMGRD